MVTSINSTAGLSNTPNSNPVKESNIGKDEFLKLLVMQLKSQNPMKPIDNMEFATQLAQFSQLEQLTNIRSVLENQNSMFESLTQALQGTAMSAMLGEYASVYSNRIQFTGENEPQIGFSLSSNVQSGEAVIKDLNGREIRRIQLSGDFLTGGEHTLSWDGKDSNGNKVPPGEYSVQIVISNYNGSTFNATTYYTGKIEAIRFKPEGTMLVVDGMEVPLKNLIEVKTRV
ncbi:MAG: Flagellar basal-body rod modification protein FlgD [Candidatus Kapaibacterium sp.]|nr:MAG: Flagellar basal-body rod modification protein FlgD [Candidatus Kapabacteria bacterium]